MLYASSASSLKEGLGGNEFAGDYAISSAAECTFAGYQHSTKKLTGYEIMTMDEMDKLEAETAEAHSMNVNKGSAIADLPLTVAEDADAV